MESNAEAEYNKKRGYDPDIDYIVGALLQMYVKKNIMNTDALISAQNKAVFDMKSLLDDISKTKLRGSKFIHLSRLYENSLYDTSVNFEGENVAIATLRDIIIPKIIGFGFNTYYTMKFDNEWNKHYPHLMFDTPYFDREDKMPYCCYRIYGVRTLVPQSMSLRKFKENIIEEYKGDFSEFKGKK